MRCYRKILHISYKDHVTNEEVRAKIQQAIGPHDDLLTIVKRRKLQWYGHVSQCSTIHSPPALFNFVCVFNRDELEHTDSTLQAKINQQQFSDLRRLRSSLSRRVACELVSRLILTLYPDSGIIIQPTSTSSVEQWKGDNSKSLIKNGADHKLPPLH